MAIAGGGLKGQGSTQSSFQVKSKGWKLREKGMHMCITTYLHCRCIALLHWVGIGINEIAKFKYGVFPCVAIMRAILLRQKISPCHTSGHDQRMCSPVSPNAYNTHHCQKKKMTAKVQSL